MASKPKTASKKSQFPKIYRIITEEHLKKVLFSLILAIAVLLVFTLAFEVAFDLQKKNNLELSHTRIMGELSFWKKTASIYPNYRDAYFNIALLDYQVGNISEAKSNLQKALEIDPNFKKGRDLEQVLSSK